jgi:hypothetical protein
MENEIWAKISYSDEYEVSNLGRIRHLYENRYDINTKKIKKIRKTKYLRPVIRDGYERVRIYESRNKFKSYPVHRLVAEAFIANPSNYTIVNHKDEDRKNNNVNNLEWCDHKYNSRYSLNIAVNQYDKNWNFIKEWNCIKDAATALNLIASNISRCCKGKTKTCGGFKWKYVYDKKNT